MDDCVVVGAEEGKVFHAVGSAARAIPNVVRLGRIHRVNCGAVEAAELAAAGVKTVQISNQLAVARGRSEQFGFLVDGVGQRLVLENERKLGRFDAEGSFQGNLVNNG